MLDFLEFKTMVSSLLIKILYSLGVIVITIGGIISLFSDFLIGLGAIIFGNLFWRLMCEAIIVVFNINDVLTSIDRKTKDAGDPRSEQV